MSAFVFVPGWRYALLQKRSKKPMVTLAGGHLIADTEDQVRSWVASGGNVGVYAGTHVVLDIDDLDAGREMIAALGPLPFTVATGSEKWHVYVRPEPGLPASLTWHRCSACEPCSKCAKCDRCKACGKGLKPCVVGQILRLPTQYAVAPPSVHSTTGERYRWLCDPRKPLPALPASWRSHLLGGGEALAFLAGDTRGHAPEEPWTGPSPEVLLARASALPGARGRAIGVKFPCPGCRASGRDRHGDNAAVFVTGRWACAVDPSHKAAIARALGVIGEPISIAGIERELLGL